MFRSYFLFCMSLILSQGILAQDPVFSQFGKIRIFTNPAVTGINGGLTITGAAREQWGSIQGTAPLWGTFRTQFAAVDYSFSSNRNGIGLFFMNDVEGDANLRTEYGGFSYSFVIPVDQWHGIHNFRLGFGLYYSRKTLQWDALLFSDQLHPKGNDYFLPISNHTQYFDEFQDNPPFWTGLSLGLMYRYSEKDALGKGKQFSLGLGYTHLVSLLSSTDVESLQRAGTQRDGRLSSTGSAVFPRMKFGPKDNRFIPVVSGGLDFQGNLSAFTTGMDLLYKNVGLGVYYRNSLANTFLNSTDALIFAFTMEIFFKESQSIELGLSYDVNINGLGAYTGSVFEIVTKYRIGKLSNATVCPALWRVDRDWNKFSFYRDSNTKKSN